MPSTRGRPRKKLKRIDAAVDALGQLGFSRDVVCKTVNNLLKVYDGDAGWPFIEEASYKLVIETILEEQEGEGEGEEERKEDEETRNDARAPEGDDDAISHPEALADTPCADGSVNWKDISCMNHCSRSSLPGQCQHAPTSGQVGEPSNASSDVDPSHSHQPAVPSKPRRKPCYGWISEEEDEAEDAPGDVHVPENQERVESAVGLRRERRRKSGWDVMPPGM